MDSIPLTDDPVAVLDAPYVPPTKNEWYELKKQNIALSIRVLKLESDIKQHIKKQNSRIIITLGDKHTLHKIIQVEWDKKDEKTINKMTAHCFKTITAADWGFSINEDDTLREAVDTWWESGGGMEAFETDDESDSE